MSARHLIKPQIASCLPSSSPLRWKGEPACHQVYNVSGNLGSAWWAVMEAGATGQPESGILPYVIPKSSPTRLEKNLHLSSQVCEAWNWHCFNRVLEENRVRSHQNKLMKKKSQKRSPNAVFLFLCSVWGKAGMEFEKSYQLMCQSVCESLQTTLEYGRGPRDTHSWMDDSHNSRKGHGS